jgi:ribonuclease BN (tRNA processing enzyme)
MGTLIGPPGTAARIGAASSEYPGKIDDITDTFDVSTWADHDEIELGGMRILARKVNHPPSTFGLRITGPDGGVLAYSGDTGVCDEVVELAEGADVFLCEASWTHDPENRPPNLHLSGREAGEAAAKAGAKSLALTHLPPWTWPDDMLAEAREVYDGPIRVVRRGEQIDIG